MSDYTRTMSVSLHELVPERSQLPRCRGWKVNGLQCVNKARYEVNEQPVCGQHVSPNVMFIPEKWLTEA